jgi:TIR domain
MPPPTLASHLHIRSSLFLIQAPADSSWLIVLFLILFALIWTFWKGMFRSVGNRSKHDDSNIQLSNLTSLNIEASDQQLSFTAQNAVTEDEEPPPPTPKREAPAEPPSQTRLAPPSPIHIPPAPKTPTTIFITYRRQDAGDVTGRIYDRLVKHFGRETIFKDVDSIPLGVDFRKFLGDAVGQCNLLLAVIGRQWLNCQSESGARRLDDPRDFVRIEIEAALQRDIPVIPLLVQGAGVPGENDLPPSLQALVYRNAISIRPDPDFHHDVDRLIKGIELHFKNIL